MNEINNSKISFLQYSTLDLLSILIFLAPKQLATSRLVTPRKPPKKISKENVF